MARLCESTPEERSRIIPCDEEGCQLTYRKTKAGITIINHPSETDCVLQLRLRVGIAAEIEHYRNDFERVFGNVTDWQWELFKKFFVDLRSGRIQRPQA